MPGRTRGPPIKEAKRDVAHESSQRSPETSNQGKWLDSLRVLASKDVNAIVAENSHAYTARQVAWILRRAGYKPTSANTDYSINEKLAEQQPTFQESALDDIARGREEHLRLVKLLEDAECMVKDVQDLQASKEAEEKFSEEAKGWLKAERERARDAMGETNTRANAHVEKGVLHFAKRASL